MLDTFAPLPVVGRTYTWSEDGITFGAWMRPEANYDIFASAAQGGVVLCTKEGVPEDRWSEVVDFFVITARAAFNGYVA